MSVETLAAPMLLRLELQALTDAYIDTIDADRLEEWPSFFTEDCLYEVIPFENERAGLPAPVIRCDSRAMLDDRVLSLRHANIFAPATYRHFLSGLRIHASEGDTVVFSSNYLVINSNQAGQSFVYQTGRYEDRAVRTRDGWRYTQKRAIFDTSRIQTLLALPI